MLGKPNSLCKLILVTQQYDNLYWERQEEWKLAHQQDNKLTMNTDLQGPNGPNPPTTQTNNHILGLDGKLKPEEWKCCWENNLCMMCGKPGHATSACPAAMRGQAVNLQEQLDTLSGNNPQTPQLCPRQAQCKPNRNGHSSSPILPGKTDPDWTQTPEYPTPHPLPM